MTAAGRNHRQHVFLIFDMNIEQVRTVVLYHGLQRIVKLVLFPYLAAVDQIAFGDCYEIRIWPVDMHAFELGIAAAAAETVAGVLLRPREVFAAMRQDAGFGGPLGFVLVMGTLTGWVALGYQYVAAMLNPAAMREALPEIFGKSPGLFFGMLAVLMPLGILITTYVSAGMFHVVLKVLAARVVSFEATFRVYCYAWGAASVLQMIPILGGYAYLGAAVYLTILGLRDVQRVPGGVAAAAVLLPAVFCCGSLVALALGVPAAEGISTLN